MFQPANQHSAGPDENVVLVTEIQHGFLRDSFCRKPAKSVTFLKLNWRILSKVKKHFCNQLVSCRQNLLGICGQNRHGSWIPLHFCNQIAICRGANQQGSWMHLQPNTDTLLHCLWRDKISCSVTKTITGTKALKNYFNFNYSDMW